MATEYELSYTASEIDEKLAKVDSLEKDLNTHYKDMYAHPELMPVAARLTLTSDGWTDDSDLYGIEKKMLVGYRTEKGGALNYIRDSGTPVIPTYEWMTYSSPFVLTTYAPQFTLTFRGSTHPLFVHPYDFMDVKVYRADDATQTNILSDDIEEQLWKSALVDTKNAIAISDGVKYQHIYRQSLNYAQINSNQAVSLDAGNYVIEFKMRLSPWLYSYSVPVPEAHSEYCISVYPSEETADVYAAHNIHCIAFGNQTLIFEADSLPISDIKAHAMVWKSTGSQGVISQPPQEDTLAKVITKYSGSSQSSTINGEIVDIVAKEDIAKGDLVYLKDKVAFASYNDKPINNPLPSDAVWSYDNNYTISPNGKYIAYSITGGEGYYDDNNNGKTGEYYVGIEIAKVNNDGTVDIIGNDDYNCVEAWGSDTITLTFSHDSQYVIVTHVCQDGGTYVDEPLNLFAYKITDTSIEKLGSPIQIYSIFWNANVTNDAENSYLLNYKPQFSGDDSLVVLADRVYAFDGTNGLTYAYTIQPVTVTQIGGGDGITDFTQYEHDCYMLGEDYWVKYEGGASGYRVFTLGAESYTYTEEVDSGCACTCELLAISGNGQYYVYFNDHNMYVDLCSSDSGYIQSLSYDVNDAPYNVSQCIFSYDGKILICRSELNHETQEATNMHTGVYQIADDNKIVFIGDIDTDLSNSDIIFSHDDQYIIVLKTNTLYRIVDNSIEKVNYPAIEQDIPNFTQSANISFTSDNNGLIVCGSYGYTTAMTFLRKDAHPTYKSNNDYFEETDYLIGQSLQDVVAHSEGTAKVVAKSNYAPHADHHKSNGDDPLAPADIGAATTKTWTSTVNTTWTTDSTNGGYYKNITYSGVVSTDKPIVDIVLGSDINSNDLKIAAYNCITRVSSYNGGITLYANKEKPTTSFQINVQVVR